MLRDPVDHDEHVQGLVAAYVLGAVTPDEAHLVEEHLVACGSCQDEVATLRDQIVARLPALAGEMTPPAPLRARLLAIVAAEAQDGVGARPRPMSTQRSLAAPPLAGQTAGPRPTVLRPTLWGARRAAPVLALAAMLTLVLIGLGIWRSIGSSPPPTAVYSMAGTATDPSIRGDLRYFAGSQRLDVDLRGLPVLPAGHVYMLWLIRGYYHVMKNVNVFQAAPDGTAHVTVVGENPAHYTLACLSVETTTQVARPTMPLVALAPNL